MSDTLPHLAITSGEPAGIGPDICLQLAQHAIPARLTLLGDMVMLDARARLLGLDVKLNALPSGTVPPIHRPGELWVQHVSLRGPVLPGTLNADNAHDVLRMLDIAIADCQRGHAQAMVTAPIHKAIINDSRIPFTGHTEYLAEKLEASDVVMLLMTDKLRIALATTHLPLSAVPEHITQPGLQRTLLTLHGALRRYFGIPAPRIRVCGLNPHAGEGGHLGNEEQTIIAPVIQDLRSQGLDILGPFSADTVFVPKPGEDTDAFLAMYHDQGLPVLKYAGFGKAANVTLGLPIIRTSVDHGTALELAGVQGAADVGSLLFAVQTAVDMYTHSSGSK